MNRVIVIGAGLAGLVAANRLADAGLNVTLLTKGIGGLQLGQGTIDVLGYRPQRVTNPILELAELGPTVPEPVEGPNADTAPEPVEGPDSDTVPELVEGPDGLRQAQPTSATQPTSAVHPYAVIGSEAVQAGLAYLTTVLPDLLVGDPETNYQLPTAVGAIRPTCLAQPSMLAGHASAGKAFVIVGFKRLKDFQPRLIAENLARTDLPDGGRLTARPLTIDVVPREGEVDSSGLTFARAFDDPEFRSRLIAAIKPQLADGEIVGLPAVLGLKDAAAWRDFAERLGHQVFEIPLLPPSVPGMRLNMALTERAKAGGVRIVQGTRTIRFAAEAGRVRSVTIDTIPAPREFTGDAFVLATGGFESGALSLDSYGTVTETLFGLPLIGTEPPLIHGDYWGAEQPLFRVGIGVDTEMRPVDASGAPVYANLLAAGGIIGGCSRWKEKSGDGIALGSAIKAADQIVKELA